MEKLLARLEELEKEKRELQYEIYIRTKYEIDN
jgi:hypothetical protein